LGRYVALALSLALCPAIFVASLVGCGAPAAPQPPTLNLPQPVRNLSAERVGDTVLLRFAVPEKTLDKLPVRGEMSARLCRSLEDGPCHPVVTASLATGQKTGSLEDRLPPDLTQGPRRLLSYRVALLNRAGKSAADSVPAYAVAGAAPPPVNGFEATAQRRGVVLSWQKIEASPGTSIPPLVPQAEGVGSGDFGKRGDPGSGIVRFVRTRTSTAPATAAQPGKPGKDAMQEPAEQTLQVPELGTHPGLALDATAHVGSSYRYTAQRIARVSLEGHDLEMAGAPGPSVVIEYRDIFPPPVPVGLVSAVDTPAHAIDLSWTPDTDPGLAGYIVYRRRIVSNLSQPGPPERITPAGKPVSAPAYRDTDLTPGDRYAYSVSAIDTSGNESARSGEVQEELATTP
jgi:hypothetical protein